MSKTIAGSILLISVVVGIGFLIGRQKYMMMTAAPPPPPEQPVSVVFDHAEPAVLRQSSTAVGTVLAPRSLQLRNEVVGTILKIDFKAGEQVSKDQILLKLDTSVEEAQLDSAKAARYMSEFALDRTKQAASVKAISELEVEQVNAMSLQSQAEVKRLEALIRKKTLRAPFDARVGLFDLHEGQYLPEGTQITMLQGLLDDYVHVDFMMPQQVADEIEVGDEIRILIEPNPMPAKIVAIDTQADRITRNVSARAQLFKPPPRLQPNDSVRVNIEYGVPINAVTIPAAALRRSPSGSFVYVVQSSPEAPEKQIAIQQMVQPGMTVGQNVAILHGLEPYTSIVSDGSFKIKSGTWVVRADPSSMSPTAVKTPTTKSEKGAAEGP